MQLHALKSRTRNRYYGHDDVQSRALAQRSWLPNRLPHLFMQPTGIVPTLRSSVTPGVDPSSRSHLLQVFILRGSPQHQVSSVLQVFIPRGRPQPQVRLHTQYSPENKQQLLCIHKFYNYSLQHNANCGGELQVLQIQKQAIFKEKGHR